MFLGLTEIIFIFETSMYLSTCDEMLVDLYNCLHLLASLVLVFVRYNDIEHHTPGQSHLPRVNILITGVLQIKGSNVCHNWF